jgi:hypothetical protein
VRRVARDEQRKAPLNAAGKPHRIPSQFKVACAVSFGLSLPAKGAQEQHRQARLAPPEEGCLMKKLLISCCKSLCIR